MAASDPKDRLKQLIQSHPSAPPSIETIETQIRTGETVPFHHFMSGDKPPAFKAGSVMGALVVVWGYDLNEQATARQFSEFLADNEASLTAKPTGILPRGIRYRGTYSVFSTSEKGTGRYRTIWSYDGLEQMAMIGAHIADADSSFGDFLRNLIRFQDRSPRAAHFQEIYQAAGGAVTYDIDSPDD